MAYRALYRAYRPGLFSQMVGQEHITAILKNQVKEGQLSHAYLFCGPRGTGKTTTAKILSRAVNCEHPVEGEPCDRCPSCLISRETNGDIIEIDAASNTGVDNVRELISQAQFAPLQLKKRVFIIDEVHMLSTSAFNALLKTLEEPPAHVLFILATTEPQKLPATVISRCQRFDFHRFTAAHIIGYLQRVLEQSGVSAEPEGLRLIARAADGAMRDALSLTDQCLSFCGSHITAADVAGVLGTMDEDFLFSMTGRLFEGDGRGCLEGLEQVVRQGSSLSVFASDLAGHMRALLFARTCGDCQDLLECTQETMARYEKQAKGVSRERLLYAAEQLLRAQSDMKYFSNPRLLLESTLLRISSPLEDSSPEALLCRIAALEDKLSALTAGGLPVQTAPTLPVPVPPRESPASAAPKPRSPADTPPWEEEYIPEAPPEEGYLPFDPYEQPAPSVAEAPAAPPPAPAAAPQRAAKPDPVPAAQNGEAQTLWQQLLQRLLKENPMLYRCIKVGEAGELDETRLTVFFTPENVGKMNVAASQRNMAILQGELEKLRPGVTAVLMERKPDAGEQKLRELFGDKLTTK